MIKIEYYSTNVGNFFRINSNYYGQTLQNSRVVEINGIDVRNLASNNGWYRFEGELKDFKKCNPQKKEQTGWKLKNPELASEKIPLTLSMEQLKQVWDSDEGEYTYNGAYSSLASLYQADYTELPAEIVPVEVELIKLRDLHVENYNTPSEMKVQVQDGSFGGRTQVQDLSTIAVFSDIERMLTPDFLLHTRPCSLTSQQVYKIIRAHVLNNIDGKVARVTSNYDFCFTVEKVIEPKPYSTKVEQLTRSGRIYKPPRFTTGTKNTKLQKIFEMTWKGYKGNSGYDGYTCIEPWEADSLQELYDNMKQYLSDLMEEINKPVVECQHCNGLGCITKSIGTNER